MLDEPVWIQTESIGFVSYEPKAVEHGEHRRFVIARIAARRSASR